MIVREKNAKNEINKGKIATKSLLKEKQLLLPKFIKIINEDSCYYRSFEVAKFQRK
jgi:hypothetical protein